jgi:YHS domain-containing protein/peroxiredoxin
MKATMTIAVVLVLAESVAWGQCGGCGTAKAGASSCCSTSASADPADVVLVSLDGDTFRMADQQGHPVALVCLKTEPDNDAAALAAQKAHEGMPDYALFGIACGDPETAAGFAERLELDYPVLLDPGCGLMKSLGVEACPAAVFISSGGKVVRVEDEIREETMSEGMQAASGQDEFVDPVCKMTVTKESAAATYEHEGKTYYFCNVGCKERFAKDPGRYLGGGE